jgi:hypothetical protein
MYSLRVGNIECIFARVRSYSLLTTMCKNPPNPTSHHLPMFKFMITSPCALQWLNPWMEDISKMWGGIQL